MNPELKHFVTKYFPKGGKALDLGCGDRIDLEELKKWDGNAMVSIL